MKQFEETVKRATGLHGKLAEAVGPSRLVCSRCGAQERPSSEDMGRYFRSGWPTCCGYTMTLEREAR